MSEQEEAREDAVDKTVQVVNAAITAIACLATLAATVWIGVQVLLGEAVLFIPAHEPSVIRALVWFLAGGPVILVALAAVLLVVLIPVSKATEKIAGSVNSRRYFPKHAARKS